MALGGCPDRVGREPPGGGRHRSRPDRPRLHRGHRDHRRGVRGPGQTAGRHRPVARTGGGDHRVRRARRWRSGRPGRGSACAPSRWTTSPRCPNPRSRPRSCPAAGLASALRQVVRAASSDDARPLLTGVLIAAEGSGSAWWPPTPTDWPCGTSTAATPSPTPRRSWCRPGRWPNCSGCRRWACGQGRRVVRHGRRGRRTADGRPTVGLSIGDHDVTFTAGDVKVSTRLLDGTLSRLPPADPGRVPEPPPRRARTRCSTPCAGCGSWCATTPLRCACRCATAAWT